MMKNKILAMMLVFLMILQLLPVGVRAEDTSSSQNTTVSSADTGTETEDTVSSNTLEAEWPETGTMNDDGSPVTAEQGDTAENSGAEENETDVMRVQNEQAEPETYTVTLDLDGGQINNMQNSGWSQSSYQVYQWIRSFTETESGAGVTLTLNNTMGGLLPGEPYRAGYSFAGWKIESAEQNADQTVTITQDVTITAQWNITEYEVSFYESGGSSLWSVEVPYGATLWTEDTAPWEEAGVSWNADNTANITINFHDQDYENVVVTRYEQSNASESETKDYYYRFTIEGVPYFTYGGKEPEKDGQHFVGWKLMSGGEGFTVTGTAAFSAQFQAEQSYVFNVYYYYENGTKAENTLSVVKTAADVKSGNGMLSFTVNIPNIPYYTAAPEVKSGVTWSNNTVKVNVNEVFGEDNQSVTNYLALTVYYYPSQITYNVEYYQQNVDGTTYTMVGETALTQAEYGSRISVEDRPSLEENVSFDGFQISAASQSAVSNGVLLKEDIDNVEINQDGNEIIATVRVYYDRASYFIYFQTGTTEVQIDPVRVRFGAKIAGLDDKFDALTREGYKDKKISWYRLNTEGNLVEAEETIQDGVEMPAYDLYAVVTWVPDTTSIRLVYWVESRNAASFQNAYTKTVANVSTEAELTVSLNDGVKISGDGWPADDNQSDAVSEGFNDLMRNRYGSDAYTTFFSYSSDQTKASPGNVANAQATGSGGVSGSTITEDSYTVRVNGDGTTTINIYYTRNQYTLEFVLARINGNTLQVANNTPGDFSSSGWNDAGNVSFTFTDFTSEDGVTAESGGGKYGDLSVQKTYRITEALDRDSRSAVGRYGTKYVEGYKCYVYTLTARFEADISALWPTAENIAGTYGSYKYISMGTDENSYYRNVFAATDQKNILNVYSTMDLNVVAQGKEAGSWSASADKGSGTVAHQSIIITFSMKHWILQSLQKIHL